MEFLTENQLQKYNTILDKINKSFEESRKLEEDLGKENNKYILNTLARNKEVLRGLSQVNVKIFSNILDLFNLYQDDLSNDIRDYIMLSDCNFYLIEIHLSKDLIQKLRGLNCLINISCKYRNVCKSRSLNFRKKLPIYEVIPIDKDIIEAIVETTLFLSLHGECIQLKLEEVSTNVSYHFSTIKTQWKTTMNTEKILQFLKLYPTETNINPESFKLSNIRYVIPFSLEVAHFIAGFIKNCYHNVDIQLLTELENGNKNKFDFSVLNQQETYSITFEKKRIAIDCNCQDMPLLKKYFSTVFTHSNKNNFDAQEILKIKNSVVETPQDVDELYIAVRNISQNVTS